MKRKLLYCLLAFGVAMAIGVAFVYLAGWMKWEIHPLAWAVIGGATYSVTYLGVILFTD